jgi:hypothetical protein
MKRILTWLVLAGFLPLSTHALESSASGSTQAAQSAVTSINSKLDSSLSALQVMITGMQNCSAQRKFYAPSDGRRDASNCVSLGSYEFSDNGTNSGDSGQLRMVAGNSGAFWRNDATNTYLLLTNAGDPNGSWNGLRPFYVTNGSGYVNMNQGLGVTGGVTTNTNDGTWALVGNAYGSGVGVYGYAANNWSGYFTGLNGVYGQGTSGIGVQGSSAGNWAGYFNGSSGVAGISSAGWAGNFNSQGTQNGVSIGNNGNNAQLCLNGDCVTHLGHAWGGSYCVSGSCQLANPFTGGCSCEAGYSSYVSANQNDRSGTWHTSYTCYK